jgi:hypothetical protein
MTKICVGLAFVQDGLPVHLHVWLSCKVAVLRAPECTCCFIVVVLWPVECFGDSPDTSSLFWRMFMVRAGAEISCHGGDSKRRRSVGCFIFVFIYCIQAIAFLSVRT